MTLSEKIHYCRKKAGKSQEALAEAVGVSRQAVSKWETGEAEPEIRKLQLLASYFGVTADWLLSEDPPAEPAPEPVPEPQAAPQTTNWVESVPVLGKLIRRYGWLFGVYTAVSGAGIAFIGLLARVLSKAMFSSFSGMNGGLFGAPGVQVFDSAGNAMDPSILNGALGSTFGSDPFASFATNNPVYLLGGILLVLGLVILAAGIVLAVVLKKRKP